MESSPPLREISKKITKFDPKKEKHYRAVNCHTQKHDDLLSFYSHGGEFRISGTFEHGPTLYQSVSAYLLLVAS